MNYILYDSTGEEIVHKINIDNIVIWLQENKYFEDNPDEVLRLEDRDLNISHIITKETTKEEIWGFSN